MAGIRFTGMASGLPPNIVDQLMEAERIPVKQMEVQKTKQEDKLKLVTDLETKVSDITKNLGELTSTSGFIDKKFVSGDPNVIEGQVDPNSAIPGDYSIEVVQLAQKPAAISNGFPDKNETQIGVGYIKFDTPEGVKEVYINGANSTLEGVVKQINAANVGLKAQVLEDRKDAENPFKLLISGLSTGKDNQVAFPKIYLLDGDQDMYFDQSRPAQNAKVKVDGFEIELPDNKSTDLIPGVTLDFKSAAPGREIRMSVKENLEVISGKIKSFVEAYNGALDFIQKQSKLQAGDGKNPKLGPLGGDGMLRSIENSLRRVILNPTMGVETPIRRVGELGIEFNRNGTLNFNQDKFNKVLNANPQGVAAFFRGDGFSTGFVSTVKREIGNLMNGQFGTIANRKKGLQDRINQVNGRIETKERQLERKEESLRRKFADLESKMSDMQAQQARFAAMAPKAG
ncbi:MAG: flagellar hook associated protein [Bdellovibrio sp. ArHS]|uniref:flagellar filament capping protein FliD n=1 Tax=Bdellovibrio sp. ArHS TaxID=1569284 RepID=UPI0005833A00|nr:flagellar filament capping protein FliD [Bdellovibrio sp. ArHS]KHD89743.1 MAG: flagellar hook associated protein [Bdellovibrio sp. ArHS]